MSPLVKKLLAAEIQRLAAAVASADPNKVCAGDMAGFHKEARQWESNLRSLEEALKEYRAR